MKVSLSVDLTLQLAGQEAIAGEFKEIQPEHLLMGVLKLAELPLDDLEKMAPGAEATRDMITQVKAVQHDLSRRDVDSTRARRELRARLGKGGAPFDGGRLHRSQASREFFVAAAKLASDTGGDALAATHLLTALLFAPTVVIQAVLGKAVGQTPAKRSSTPLLDEHGQDLTALAAAGRLPCPSALQAESKAILQALAEKSRRSVLLVANTGDIASQAVVAAAHAVAKGECPASMKGRRIVDLTSQKADRDSADELLDKLVAEAETAPEVILVLPLAPADAAAGSAWTKRLHAILAKGTIQCLCQIEPRTFDRLVRQDRTWKRAAEVIRLHGQPAKGIPWEL
jgi:ATP-dependent Clp protease ATP-binding subunit ClpC